MKKTFALNTEPHVADVGGTELEFEPEVMGDDFMDAYAELRDTHQAAGIDLERLEGLRADQLRSVHRSLRSFLARLMLPESAAVFTRLNVVQGSKTLESFEDHEEAQAHAAEAGADARVVDALRLPDRVLVELLEWVVELYGGGGQRPPTSSGGSVTASPPAGKRGTGVSPSKASTRTRGR